MKKPKSITKQRAQAARGAKRNKRAALVAKNKYARNLERKKLRERFDRQFRTYMEALQGRAAL